jgi:hypothetical protein
MFLRHMAVVAVFYGAHVVASIVGVWLLDSLRLGNMVFDRRTDPWRLAVSSALILAPPLLLLYVVTHAPVLLLYLPLFPLVTKLVYPDITLPELIVLGRVCVAGTALVGTALSGLLSALLR